VNSFGTGTIPDSELAEKVVESFDFSVEGSILAYDLKQPRYRQMTLFGPFGDVDFDAPWETPKEI